MTTDENIPDGWRSVDDKPDRMGVIDLYDGHDDEQLDCYWDEVNYLIDGFRANLLKLKFWRYPYLSDRFNRVVYVRSTNNAHIELLQCWARYPSGIIQRGQFYGFGAYFDVPRPTRENCRQGRDFIDQVESLGGVEHIHCSVLAMWMDLEIFVQYGKSDDDDHKKDWPKLEDLPESEREPFSVWLKGSTVPAPDAYYPWDYRQWKAGLPATD